VVGRLHDPVEPPLRVLVVEDSETDCALVLRALEREGFRTHHARVYALADLRKALQQGGWDVVISDFSMPAMDGFTALAEVKACLPDVPFILVSGTVGEDVAVESLKKGADDYILKSSLARLAPAVRRAVHGAELRGERIRERNKAEAAAAQERAVRERDERQIRRLNRVYAVLSGISGLIVRVRNQETLFREASRIAVEAGGFAAAWIAVLDPASRTVRPIGEAGRPDILKRNRRRLAKNSLATYNLIENSLKEKRPLVFNNVDDPRLRHQADHRELGVRSMAGLPLLAAGKPAAILSLHSGEDAFFDASEMKLLTELAENLSFGLDYLANLEKLDQLAYYDALTGWPNRHLFDNQVGEALAEAGQQGGRVALGILDLQGFKNINDNLGEEAGDELLRQVAQRLADVLSDRVLCKARLGADQFAIVAGRFATDEELAKRVEAALQRIFGPAFMIQNTELRALARVGLAIFPDHGGDGRTLFRHAEAALKKAKASGEPYLFFSKEMTARVAAKVAMANNLRRALERGEFVLHYQPKVRVSDRTMTGVEALIRWNDSLTGRQVPPMQFIPLLEETGLIAEVGAWALTQAARDRRAWRNAGGAEVPRVAVNVSPIQLRRRDFVKTVAEAIKAAGGGEVEAAGLDLEITESLIMEDFAGNVEKLRELRAMGVAVAIDDFGTGYSSLAYLARLPVETLKIDRSFIITMLKDPNVMTLVRTVIALAQSFHLEVVAEGVDDEAQANVLKLLNCDQMQGYLFSKPVPAANIAALLAPAGEIGVARADGMSSPRSSRASRSTC